MRMGMLVMGLLVVATLVTGATATTWTGGFSDNWSDSGNWDTGTPPQGPIAAGGVGSGGDVIMSISPAFQPVAESGETIGATVINNFGTSTPGAASVITFKSGSFGDFYNMTGPDLASDPTGGISYDVQAGAVVTVANELLQSYPTIGPIAITLAGTINAKTYFSGTTGTGSFDILPGGMLTVDGDVTGDFQGWITDGVIETSVPGYQVEASFDGGSGRTSVYAVVPEPISLMLASAGLLGTLLLKRRRIIFPEYS